MNLKLTQVKISKKVILQKISLQAKPGQTIAILGRNGSGKSTLLNAITNHPVTSYTGTVKLENPVFLGFQKPIEIPELLTINLLVYLHKVRTGVANTIEQFYEIYEDILKELSLDAGMLEKPLNTQVSGGENKRIEMLQMFVLQPKTLLLDEIDTGLDLDAQIQIGKFIQKYIKQFKPTVLVVTHNMSFLKYFSITKAIVLADGKIVAEGKSELIRRIEQKGFAAL
jgi:Fe-S cluster assembly ATP-binding protein